MRDPSEIPSGLIAVMVTFEPPPSVAANIAALAREAGRVLIVDNGSSPEAVATLRACVGDNVELLAQPRNLGIATALNIGVRHALTAGAEFVLLMDQDSRVTPGFGAAMVAAFRELPDRELPGRAHTAVLVPRYTHADHGAEVPMPTVPDGAGGLALEAALTSGSVVPAQVFREHGLFRDELFIDSVDHEWSLRLRSRGLVLRQTQAATLVHGLGTPATHDVGGRRVQTVNYSPLRRRYQERNKLWMLRHYGRRFPRFTAAALVMSAKDFAKVLLFEQRKATKLAAFVKGWRDGLLGRTGPIV